LYKTLLLFLSLIIISCGKTDQPEDKKENSGKGFQWSENISAADIPETPIKGMINGAEVQIEYVNFEQWRGSGDNVLNFSSNKPRQNCGFVENDSAYHFTHKGGEIKQGELVKAAFDTNLDGYVADFHYYKGADDMVKKDVPWNCALVITELGEQVVKGKIAICFKDEKKSWIAGTFEAVRCNN
jgi:hypothetical protein